MASCAVQIGQLKYPNLDKPALPFAQDQLRPEEKALASTKSWHTINGTWLWDHKEHTLFCRRI
jgi:hypothetical protein